MNRWALFGGSSVIVGVTLTSWYVLHTSAPEQMARSAVRMRESALAQAQRPHTIPSQGTTQTVEQRTATPARSLATTPTRSDAPDVTLWGTLMAEEPGQALAILQEGTEGIFYNYRVGDRVHDWTLAEIGRGHIILQQGERIHRVELTGHAVESPPLSEQASGERPELSSSVVADQAFQPHPWLAREEVAALNQAITPVSDTERVVARHQVLDVLKGQHPLRVVREASLRPAFAGGRLIGATLQSVPEDGVLRHSGFEAGDIVTEVNGQPVTNPTLLLQLPSTLAQEDVIRVTVQRNGHPVTLTYRMQ